MPSIPVDPESLSESTAGGPVIAGVAFPRATSATANTEPARSVVELANGATRAYNKGVREVLSVGWARMREEWLDALRAAIGSASYVSYRHPDGREFDSVDTIAGIQSEAIAGTFPIRYSVSVSFREQSPTL